MTTWEVITLVINVVSGFALLGLLALQFELWNRWHSEVHSALEECGTCASSNALRSSAQKFAVYWAIQRAKFLDAIIDKLGKTYAPFPFLITIFATFAKWQMLSSQKQGVDKLLTETQPVLYYALAGEIVTVLLLVYIHRHVTAFKRMFPKAP